MSETTSPTNKRSAIRTVYAYLKKYRRGLIIGSVCLFFANILMLIHPWLLKLTIDSLDTGTTTEQLLRFCYLFVGVVILSGIFRFLMRRIMIGISRKIEVDIREAFFSHLETLSPSFYMENRTGDLMALATNDLNAVRALFGPGVMYTMNTVVISIFAFSLMIALSWKLTLVSLLPMALLSIAVYHSVKAIHRLFLKVQEKFGVLNSRAQENLSGIRVVKAYAREDHEIEEFEKLSFSYVGENMKLFKIQSLLMPLLTFVAGLGALLILGYGGKQVIDGHMTLGSFVAYNGYLTMLIWPMIALGWVMNVTQRGLASLGRIRRVMDAEPAITDPPDSADKKIPTGYSIRFDSVGFTYPGTSEREPALRDVSFEFKDGETTAIVGATGSGKTTLISLILRLHDVTSGRITIGDIPVEEIPLHELRRQIGLVPQDIFLFSDTIRENIAFGTPTIDDTLLDNVSRISAIKHEVEGFPDKYESVIGERGINLSGGQKQRLAIARALARDPKILILDDALSSVDTNTEERILSMLRDEMKKRTAILISHRISTVKEADRIIVMDGGEVKEMGTHSELLELGGIYRVMYQKQLIEADLESA